MLTWIPTHFGSTEQWIISGLVVFLFLVGVGVAIAAVVGSVAVLIVGPRYRWAVVAPGAVAFVVLAVSALTRPFDLVVAVATALPWVLAAAVAQRLLHPRLEASRRRRLGWMLGAILAGTAAGGLLGGLAALVAGGLGSSGSVLEVPLFVAFGGLIGFLVGWRRMAEAVG